MHTNERCVSMTPQQYLLLSIVLDMGCNRKVVPDAVQMCSNDLKNGLSKMLKMVKFDSCRCRE